MNIISKDFLNFIKFAIVGVVNTLLNFVIFAILSFSGVHYIIANVIAYTVATANSYFWNSRWVFNHSGGFKSKASMKFFMLNLVGLILNTSIMFVLVEVFDVMEILALVFATGIVMIFNYIFNKIWVFKNK